jgi:hypothetical protein
MRKACPGRKERSPVLGPFESARRGDRCRRPAADGGIPAGTEPGIATGAGGGRIIVVVETDELAGLARRVLPESGADEVTG